MWLPTLWKNIRSRLEKLAEEVRWHDDPTQATFYEGDGTQYHSLGEINLPFSHSFRGSRDVLETDGAELRPLPIETPVNNDTVIFVLPCKQTQHLMASVVHISEARTAIQASDVSISSFTSTPMPYPHVFGKYGIEGGGFLKPSHMVEFGVTGRKQNILDSAHKHEPDFMIYEYPDSVKVLMERMVVSVRPMEKGPGTDTSVSRRHCVANTAQTFFLLDTSGMRESWSLTTQEKSTSGDDMLKDVKGEPVS